VGRVERPSCSRGEAHRCRYALVEVINVTIVIIVGSSSSSSSNIFSS
jgi:hypothetical protein